MVEIALVCCERQRTECRVRLKNSIIDAACEEKQYSLEFVTIYLMRLCVYQYISRKYIPMCASGVHGMWHAINFYIS